MVFGLFKSSEDKLKEHISKTYDNYLSILKTVPDDEIGFVLDYAVKIKSSSTLFDSEGDYLKVFEDPTSVKKQYLLSILNDWQSQFLELSKTQEGLAKSGALSIWYMSAGAFAFPELKNKYTSLWSELGRGFYLCKEFNPEKDIPSGNEDDLENIENEFEEKEINYLKESLNKVLQPIIDLTNNNLPKKLTNNYEVCFYLNMYAGHCYRKKHNIDLSSDPTTQMNEYIYSTKATQQVLQLNSSEWDLIMKSNNDYENNDEWFQILSGLKNNDYSLFLNKAKTLLL